MEAAKIRETELGELSVSLHAITQIAERSLSECYGVLGLGKGRTFRRALSLGQRRNVTVRVDEQGIDLMMRVAITYGLNLAEVAASIRSRVSYEIERVTGLPVTRVEVHVEDARPA